MVDAGKITLRIEVDAKEFQRLMKGSTKDLSKFKEEVDRTEPSMKKLGDSATTTAVRFQTLTQGTINLVTSFTQAYTSISNLQKAKTSLQAAAVGVERAIDLQRRKQFMLNEEMAKAAPNMKKVELLTNELATAHDDLAVKQQRVKDQADQVNDTYILFALNIANVGFSAVQTGVSMAKMAQGIKLATVASTAFNAVTSKYTIIALTAIAAWEGLSMVIRIFNKDLGESMSIISNVTNLMNQFTGASDITLDHYDSKISGVTQSTTEFENSWKSMTSTVKKETNEQNKLVFAWKQQYRQHLNDMKQQMAGMDIHVPSLGGSQANFPKAQQGIEVKVQKTEKKVDSLFDYIFPNVPSAHAETHIEQQIHKQDNNVFVPDPNLTQTLKFPAGNITVPANMQQQYAAQGGVFEYTTQEKADKLKAWKAQMLAEGKGDPERQKLLHYEPYPVYTSKPNMFMQAYTQGKTVEQLKYEQEENRIQGQRFKILQEIEQVQNAMVQWQDDDGQLSPLLKQKFAGELARLDNQLIPLDNQLFNLQNPSVTKPPVVGEPSTPVIPETERQRRKREHEEAKAARKNTMRYYTSIFKSKTKPKAISFTIGSDGRYSMNTTISKGIAYGGIGGLQMAMSRSKGGTFGMGNRMLGTREGNMIEALRWQQMATIDPTARRQTTNIDVSGFEVDRGQANAAQLAAYMGGASSLSEVRGSTRWDKRNAQVIADRRRQLDIRDANENALRFGGRLREGMTVWDEGAVIGGYGSRAAYSKAAKATFYAAVDEAVRIGNFFGIVRGKSYGRSGRRSQNTLIKNTMEEITGALSLAGLGYTTINTRLGSRPDQWEIIKLQRDMAETRAFNQNQLAKARQINLLQQQYGLSGFTGTTMSLDALTDRVAMEDEKMAALGLTRSQAIGIVAAQGRGRQEIEDRLRFSEQLEAMSSGTSPL